MDYYQILGLARDAAGDEIERAFRELARRVHPDLNVGDKHAEARMKQLNEIRETLSDPLLRTAYDAELRRGDTAAAPTAPGQAGPTAAAADGPSVKAHPHASARSARAGTVPFTIETERRAHARGARSLLLFLVGVLALASGAVMVVVPWLRGSRRAPEAPPPAVALPPPVEPRRAPPRPPRGAGHGVVRLGSTAAEVLQAFGPPDRIERAPGPNSAVMVYGSLRLRLRNGQVVSGAP